MIKQRGGAFQADFMLGGKRIRKQFTSAASAEKFEKEAMARAVLNPGSVQEFVQAKTTTGAPTTLKALFEKVQEIHWSSQKSPETSESNSTQIVRYLGDIPLNTITNDIIDKLVGDQIKDGKAKSSINRKLSCIQKALGIAAERGWYTLPMPKFRRLPEPKGRLKFFTPVEEKHITDWFKWAADQEMADLVTVLADTGMRLSEALRIEVRDLDLGRQLIRVWVDKADNPRSIPMTQRVIEVLTRRCPQEGRVFSYTKDIVEHKWTLMRAGIGITNDPQFVIHTLRHTCASRLINGGEDLLTVKEFLGHKSIQTTLRYAHLAPEKLKLAAKRLESYGTAGCLIP